MVLLLGQGVLILLLLDQGVGVVLLLGQRVCIVLQMDWGSLAGMEAVDLIAGWLVNGRLTWKKQIDDLIEELLQDILE